MFLLLALPMVVAGQPITINGEHSGEIDVIKGGRVTISIQELEDNQHFKLGIQSIYPHLTPTGLEIYRLDNFFLPFTLDNGLLNAEGTNINFLKCSIKKGGVTANVQKNSIDETSGVTLATTYQWNKGIYDYIELSGQISDLQQKVSLNVSVEGKTKESEGEHELKFDIKGAKDGKIRVKVFIDSATKADVIINIVSIEDGNGNDTPPSLPDRDGGGRTSGYRVPSPTQNDTNSSVIIPVAQVSIENPTLNETNITKPITTNSNPEEALLLPSWLFIITFLALMGIISYSYYYYKM